MNSLGILIKVAGLTALTELAYYLCVKIYRQTKHSCNQGSISFALKKMYDIPFDQNFNKVIFFPDPGIACRRILSGRPCRDQHCPAVHEKTSLNVLINVLNLSKCSIDVCVYMITCGILGDVLVDCQKRGVVLKIITEERNSGEEGEMTGSQIGKLRSAAVEVRSQATSFWMHHKFCIVDNEILINGSFNWTNQAVMGNSENLMITNEPSLVKPFTEEFKRLWEDLNPRLDFSSNEKGENCNGFC